MSSTKWFQKRGHDFRDLKVKKLFEDTFILIFKKNRDFLRAKVQFKIGNVFGGH